MWKLRWQLNIFQEHQLNSRRFPVFPEAILYSWTFPGVVDTVYNDQYDVTTDKCYTTTEMEGKSLETNNCISVTLTITLQQSTFQLQDSSVQMNRIDHICWNCLKQGWKKFRFLKKVLKGFLKLFKVFLPFCTKTEHETMTQSKWSIWTPCEKWRQKLANLTNHNENMIIRFIY